jgi:hypothetical protein
MSSVEIASAIYLPAPEPLAPPSRAERNRSCVVLPRQGRSYRDHSVLKW